MWSNTQLTRQITQFTHKLKNETVQKWLATMNDFINEKYINNNYNEVKWINSHMQFESM